MNRSSSQGSDGSLGKGVLHRLPGALAPVGWGEPPRAACLAAPFRLAPWWCCLVAFLSCAPAAQAQVAAVRALRAIGQAVEQAIGGQPAQPGQPPAPPAPPTGPAVVTVYEERLALKPTAIEDGQLVLPTEPPRKIPLDEIDSVDLGNTAVFEAQWIGQDNRDLAQVGAAAGGNGIQDIHVRLSGVPLSRQIKQVLIHGVDPNHGVWRLDTAMTPNWRIALERIEGATGADIFFEPKSVDSFERDYSLTVTYDDGSTASAQIKGATHTNDKLALAGEEGAPGGGDGPAAVTVYGHGGVLLRGQLLEMTDKEIRVKTSWGAETSFPTLEIRGLWFGASQTAEAKAKFNAVLAAPGAEDSALALGKEQAISAVTGTAESFSAGKLQFQFQGRPRAIGAARLVGLVFAARPAGQALAGAHQVFYLTGGDRLAGLWKGIGPEALQVQASWGGEFSIPQNLISQVKFLNGKLSYVSDLEPAAVEEAAYFGRAMPYRRDKSLLGGPLKVKGKEYPKGLAVHSRSALTYNIDGQFKQFKSTVGFDESAGNHGRVLVRVLGDGKELFAQPALRADGEPAAIEAAIEGVKQLTLEVDFGELEDSGDRVVWADAKLFREIKAPDPAAAVPTGAPVPADAAAKEAAEKETAAKAAAEKAAAEKGADDKKAGDKEAAPKK